MAEDAAILPKDKQAEKRPPRLRRRKLQPPDHLGGSLLCVITILSLAFIALVGYSFRVRQQDTKACNMAYMYPSYKRLHGFDLEHTRFAKKYSLYLYREQTIDFTDTPQGVPVLFVPGNAGSYKQIRPIAAEAAAQFQELVKLDASILDEGKRSLDFFTVDFNEDFSAFHGQTMLDQAEYLNSAITYILSMYSDARKSPSDQSLPDPMSVIILGHSMGGIVARTMQIMPNYLPKSINTIITMSTPHALPPAPFDSQIQSIYRDINSYWYESFSSDVNALQDVSLVSIAGGGLDTIVSSDYSSIKTIVPLSNGFTIFTSTIPHAWTSADHQAILWCDQFRRVLARAILETVDVRRASQTTPIGKRITILRNHLLSRLDRQDYGPTVSDGFPVSFDSLEVRKTHVVKNIRELQTGHQMYLLPTENKSFRLITNLEPGVEGFTVSLCREAGIIDLSCVDVTQDATVLPSEQDLKHDGDSRRQYFMQFDDVKAYQFVMIQTWSSEGFMSANFASNHEVVVEPTLSMFMDGVVLKFNDSIVSSVRVPSRNSMIAYKVTTSMSCGLMQPITRQHISDPYETKYHIGHDFEVSIHGQSPFFSIIDAPGLLLQHWPDPSCGRPGTMTIKIDYIGSLGKLVMRYRVVLVAFPSALAFIVFFLQLRTYQRTNVFVSFQQGIRSLLGRPLLAILVLITGATISLIHRQQNMAISSEQLFTNDLKHIMSRNDLLLGLQDMSLCWLAPVFVLVSIGILNVVSLGMTAAIWLLATLLTIIDRRSPSEHIGRSFIRRVITTIILLGIVATIVPYQFAYIVACMVELATCVRLHRHQHLDDMPHAQKAYNFNFSLFTLMICVLPISLPILVVWIRNLSVQWLTPFSSHHNVLSVAPIILLVECLTKGTIAPPTQTYTDTLLGLVILIMAALITAYGVMYTFILHHLLNILAFLLFLRHHVATPPPPTK